MEVLPMTKQKKLRHLEYYDLQETFDKLYNYIKTNDREGMRDMMRLSTKRRRLFNKKV